MLVKYSIVDRIDSGEAASYHCLLSDGVKLTHDQILYGPIHFLFPFL